MVLCFGLMRPYKGIDLLLDAWGDGLGGAELWIVGMARMDTPALRAARARRRALRAERFVADDELPALFGRAQLVVLPYREAEAVRRAVHRARRSAGRCCSATWAASESWRPRAPPASSRPAVRRPCAPRWESCCDEPRGSGWPQRPEAARGPHPWRSVAWQTVDLYASLLR